MLTRLTVVDGIPLEASMYYNCRKKQKDHVLTRRVWIVENSVVFTKFAFDIPVSSLGLAKDM